MASRLFTAVAASGILALCGCSSAMIEKASEAESRSYGLQIVDDGPRRETVNLLENLMLYEKYERDPEGLLAELRSRLEADSSPELVLAMADIAYWKGRDAGDDDTAARYFLTSMLYAYTFIAAGDSSGYAGLLPERLSAMQLYNKALLEFFKNLRFKKMWRHDSFQFTTICGRRVGFARPQVSLPFDVGHYRDFLPCADYRTRGLTHDSYRFGIGIPLIGLPVDYEEAAGVEDFDSEVPEAATAVLRFFKTGAGSDNDVQAKMCLYATRQIEDVDIAGRRIPLALDFSTPGAYSTRLKGLLELTRRMLNPEDARDSSGLYFLEPVDPEKIPVVFVHGLMSSPQTWIQMLNTLQSDPEIRRNYQFWGFSYSTGNPVLYSAAMLRSSLIEMRRKMHDSGRSTDKFDRMVLVGHSMGGLLSKAMIVSSGDVLAETILGVSNADIGRELSLEHKQMIRDIMFFEPVPFVRRVIFIAVPHRGSDFATTWIGRLGTSLTRIPVRFATDIGSMIADFSNGGSEVKKVTGISNLDPSDTMLPALASRPFAPDVPYHSIIGNKERDGVPGGSDGIVPYSSSHLDGAGSELIVKSDHSAQQNPIAIQEVRRILKQHLRQYDKSSPVSGAPSLPEAASPETENPEKAYRQ